MATIAELKAELRELEGYESDTPFDENFGDEGVNKVRPPRPPARLSLSAALRASSHPI